MTNLKANSKKSAAKANKSSKKAEAPKVEAKTEAKETIGSFTKTCILAGMAVKAIEAAIKEKFPECGPQLNSIYFYRSKLNKAGLLKKSEPAQA